MKKLLIAFILVFSAGSVFAASTVRLDPYDGSWAPGGTWAWMQYFNHAGANTIKDDGDVVSRNADFTVNVAVTRIATWQDIAGQPVHISFIIPYGEASMDGDATGQRAFKSSGLGDMELVLCTRILHWESGYVNLGLTTGFPTGEYHYDSQMNMGANRYFFRPEVHVAQNIGKFTVNFFTEYTFYTDNDKHGMNQDTLEKDGEYHAEVHFTYMIMPETKSYAGIGFGGTWGGKEEVGSATVATKRSDYGVKFTLGTDITERVGFMLNYLHEIENENGPEGFQLSGRIMVIF